MDIQAERLKAKWLLIAIAGFIITGCLSWVELKYAIWGVSTYGNIIEVRETYEVGSRGRHIPKQNVHYSFEDRVGQLHDEHENVSMKFPIPAEKIAVQYLPGVKNSPRIRSWTYQIPVWIFTGCILFLAVVLARLAHEASSPPSYGKKRAKRADRAKAD